MLALRAIGAAGAVVFRRLPTLVMANVTAAILSAPAAVLALLLAPRSSVWFGLAAVTVAVGVLPNPAAAGLQYLVFQFLNVPILVTIWDQFSGLREYFVQALKLWLIALPVTGLLVGSIVFYGRVALIGLVLQALIVCVTYFWIGIQFYLYPLLLTQEDRSVRTTYRNAIVLTLGRPFYTFIAILVWLVILAIGTATGTFVIFGFALAAAIQHAATKRILSRVKMADGASAADARQ